MRTEGIRANNNTQFKANVLKTPALTASMEYMQKHSHPKKGFYDSAPDLALTKKIIKAFTKHPSKENIEIEETFRYNEMFNARGVISSSKATLVDTEPARSDSIAPVLNVLRRIVDPANKKSFNKLVGEEYSKDYQPWWNKNIKPIWGQINERFREETCFEGNRDAQFNAMFNAQSGEKRQVTSTMKDGQFVDYRKIKEAEQVSDQKPEEKHTNKFISYLKAVFG